MLAAEKAPKKSKLNAKAARQQMYRDLILEAGERQFAQYGFEQTKVTQIADTADVSLATVYKTFSGKDEIFDSIHQVRMTDLVHLAVDAAKYSKSTYEGLLSGCETLIRFFIAHPNYLLMQLRDGKSWAVEAGMATRADAEQWRIGIDMMEQFVQSAIDDGKLVSLPPRLIAQNIVATIQVWLASWVEDNMQQTVNEVTSGLLQQIQRSFAIRTLKTSQKYA